MVTAAESEGQALNEVRADLPGSQVPPHVLATLPSSNFPSRSHDKGKVHFLKGTYSFAVIILQPKI